MSKRYLSRMMTRFNLTAQTCKFQIERSQIVPGTWAKFQYPTITVTQYSTRSNATVMPIWLAVAYLTGYKYYKVKDW